MEYVNFDLFKMALTLSGIGAGLNDAQLKGIYAVSKKLAEKGEDFDLKDAAKIYSEHFKNQPRWEETKIAWVDKKGDDVLTNSHKKQIEEEMSQVGR